MMGQRVGRAIGRPVVPAIGDAMPDNAAIAIMLGLIVIIYLLPTIIAYGRDHPHRHAVALLNILFGWTLIGWFLLFLWAALSPRVVEAV
jgi:hypothetical protein